MTGRIWNQTRLNQMRTLAAEGKTQRETAELLNCNIGTLKRYSSVNGIKFGRHNYPPKRENEGWTR